MRIINITRTALLLTLLTSGCSSTTAIHLWENDLLSPAYSNRGDVKQQPNMEQQANMTCRKIERALADDNLEQAQKFIVDSDLKMGGELQRDELYVTVIKRLLLAAEQAGKEGLPEQEGKFFILAKELYPTAVQDQSSLNLSLDEIDKKIQRCAEETMKKGLLAYRSGDLEGAVGIWEEIGEFLPNHPPALIAVKTTRQQLHNLKILTSKAATEL